MKIILVLLIYGFIVSCAPQMVWVKDGSSQSDFKKDHYICLQEARVVLAGNPAGGAVYSGSSQGGGGFWGSATDGVSKGAAMAASAPRHYVDRNLYSACMEARGWESQPK
jgi:hypothetical protein